MKPRSTLVLMLLAASIGVPAPAIASEPGQREIRLADEQLLLLREASRVIDRIGDDVWPGWDKIAKTTLIVAGDREFLVNLPRRQAAPTGFIPGTQTFEGRRVYTRSRRLDPNLRATFPIAGVPVTVVGAWVADVESPSEWVLTLVEQWFRLLQLDRGEQRKFETLHLGSGAEPSWQVAYEFPYDDPDVGNAMLLLGESLYDFWETGSRLPREGQRLFLAQTAWAALQNLRAILTLKYGSEAYEYFQLQTWREGVARYSGLRVAARLAIAEQESNYDPERGFDALPAHKSYADTIREDLAYRFWLIRTSVVEGARDRTSFQALGHGLAELLDSVNSEWKLQYFDPALWLDDLVAASLETASDIPRASARQR